MEDNSSNAKQFILECSRCRACEGAAYQTPPASYIGTLQAPVLILAQNPGEFADSDKDRNWWANRFQQVPNLQNNEAVMKTWYEYDFGTSYGAKMIGRLVGNSNWTTSGGFCFSNAIRCRTPNNAQPSVEMLVNCTEHTRALLRLWAKHNPDPMKRVLIVMEATAKSAILRLADFNLEPAFELKWGEHVVSETFGHVLPVKHYAAWRGEENRYRAAFREVVAKSKLDHTPEQSEA